MAVITVIGSGQMGSALAFPAAENGHEVRLVGTMLDEAVIDSLRENGWHPNLKRTLPPGCKYYRLEELDDALTGCELVIAGVSSFGVDWFAEDILPKLPDELPILSITKGMLDGPSGEMVTYPHHYLKIYPAKNICAVGGPCTSYELADHDPTQVCFCGNDPATLRWMKSLMQTDYYHISLSTDVTGVECAVAMKNAYALGVTLAVGLAQRDGGEVLHYNSQAALFGQSVREMRRLLALCGGGDDNIVYGAGDLYVTVFGGRTRKIGTLLGLGQSYEQAMAALSGVTLESVVISTRTARAVRALAAAGKARVEDFPLLFHVDAILNEGARVNIPWQLFETEQLTEHLD